MTFEQTKAAIRDRFKTLVADVQSLTTTYDNAPFTEPETGKWARLTILSGQSTQITVGAPGNNLSRYPGLVVIQMFDLAQQGDKNLLALADAINAAFSDKVLSGITYRRASLQEVGTRGKWYQVNVNIPFLSDSYG
jgi:hypothetical protein